MHIKSLCVGIALIIILSLPILFLPENEKHRIEHPYPTFEISYISGRINGSLVDKYVFTDNLYFSDTYIYGCHIRATNGVIRFEGNITLNNTVISSYDDLLLIFCNAQIRIIHTFIWAKGNMLIRIANSTFITDNVSYFSGDALSIYITESDNTFIGRLNLFSYPQSIHFSNTNNVSLAVNAIYREGIFRIYYGLNIYAENSTLHLTEYEGADIGININRSVVNLSGLYDDIGWLDVSITARYSEVRISHSKINSLKIRSLDSSTLYMEYTVLCSGMNLGDNIGHIHIGEHVLIKNRELRLIHDQEYLAMENQDLSDKIYYLYNISRASILDTDIYEVHAVDIGVFKIANARIKNLLLRGCSQLSIKELNTTKISLSDINNASIRESTMRILEGGRIAELYIINSKLVYLDLQNTQQIIILRSNITNGVASRNDKSYVTISGVRIESSDNLTIINTVLSSTAKDDFQGYILWEYSHRLELRDVQNIIILNTTIDMRSLSIGTQMLRIENTQLLSCEVFFSLRPRTLRIRDLYIDGNKAIIIANMRDVCIDGAPAIISDSFNITVENTSFLFLIGSNNVTIANARNLYIFDTRNITITRSDIKFAEIYSCENVKFKNTMISGLLMINRTHTIRMVNVKLNGSSVYIDRGSNILIENIELKYISEWHIPIFLRVELSLMFILCEDICVHKIIIRGTRGAGIATITCGLSYNITFKNIDICSASLYVMICESYGINICDISGSGQYFYLVSIRNYDLALKNIATNSEERRIYILGSEKIAINDITGDYLVVQNAGEICIKDSRISKGFYLLYSSKISLIDIDVDGYGFIPILTKEQLESLEISSLTYHGQRIVILANKDKAKISGNYGQVIVANSNSISVDNSHINTMFAYNTSSIKIRNTRMGNLLVIGAKDLNVVSNIMIGKSEIYDSENIVMRNNIIFDELYMRNARNVRIEKNLFALKHWLWITIYKSENILISDNRILDGCMRIESCTNISLIGNQILGSYPLGLMLKDNILVFIAHNIFKGTGYGGSLQGHLWWYYETDQKEIPVLGAMWIYNNRFVVAIENEFGGNRNIAIIDDSKRIYFIANNFMGNRHLFYIWDSDCHFFYRGVGNYWCGYRGVDTNKDGVYETPYQFEYGVDKYPLRSPISIPTVSILAIEKSIFFQTVLLIIIFVLAVYVGLYLGSETYLRDTKFEIYLLIAYIILLVSNLIKTYSLAILTEFPLGAFCLILLFSPAVFTIYRHIPTKKKLWSELLGIMVLIVIIDMFVLAVTLTPTKKYFYGRISFIERFFLTQILLTVIIQIVITAILLGYLTYKFSNDKDASIILPMLVLNELVLILTILAIGDIILVDSRLFMIIMGITIGKTFTKIAKENPQIVSGGLLIKSRK